MTQKQKQPTLFIGVTGHRYISSDDPELVKQVIGQLRELRKEQPDARFVLLSGLAEGADRLVAHVAMEQFEATLVPVLALPVEEFTKDFATTESRQEFSQLISKAETVITAPLLSENAWHKHGEERNDQYAWIGAFIARFSDVLFALWDGKEPKGKGGTGDVVQWFSRKSAPALYDREQDALAASAGLVPERNEALRMLMHLKVL